MLCLVWPGKPAFDPQFARHFDLYASLAYSQKMLSRHGFVPSNDDVNHRVLTAIRGSVCAIVSHAQVREYDLRDRGIR
jgi:hypothetical protein